MGIDVGRHVKDSEILLEPSMVVRRAFASSPVTIGNTADSGMHAGANFNHSYSSLHRYRISGIDHTAIVITQSVHQFLAASLQIPHALKQDTKHLQPQPLCFCHGITLSQGL